MLSFLTTTISIWCPLLLLGVCGVLICQTSMWAHWFIRMLSRTLRWLMLASKIISLSAYISNISTSNMISWIVLSLHRIHLSWKLFLKLIVPIINGIFQWWNILKLLILILMVKRFIKWVEILIFLILWYVMIILVQEMWMLLWWLIRMC